MCIILDRYDFCKNIFIEKKSDIGYEQREYGYSIATVLFIASKIEVTVLPCIEKI